jgi:cytosine/uracil/thiamine/allantoin permease
VPGFARAVATPGGAVADPNFFDRVYAYAWFVTFGLSFVAYLVLMRTHRSGTPPGLTA